MYYYYLFVNVLIQMQVQKYSDVLSWMIYLKEGISLFISQLVCTSNIIKLFLHKVEYLSHNANNLKI